MELRREEIEIATAFGDPIDNSLPDSSDSGSPSGEDLGLDWYEEDDKSNSPKDGKSN